ncbi:hypothetical protein G9A89_017904 [Geosiphon pyriformis]|nr:hypothetical protein G9A89_017904 [Geosiphon pyriformis]
MKLNHLFLAFLSLTVTAMAADPPAVSIPGSKQAQLTGWPPMDAPPPINQPWFRKIDMTQIPNIPVRKSISDCPPKGASNPNCAWSCDHCESKDDVFFCPNKNDWGLTFDDGPASSETGNLLKILDTLQIKATFFIVGSRVVEFPATLNKTLQLGHQIGVHTWSHTPLTTQTNEEIIAEMLWTEKIIKDSTGIVPKYMRPPQGDIDNRVRAIMKLLGYIIVGWSFDSGDFSAASGTKFNPDWIVSNLTNWMQTPNSGRGVCSLEHDIHRIAVNAVPIIVPIIKKAGYRPQTIASCLGDQNPYQTLSGNVANIKASNTTSSSTTTKGSTSDSPQDSSNSASDSASKDGTAASSLATSLLPLSFISVLFITTIISNLLL